MNNKLKILAFPAALLLLLIAAQTVSADETTGNLSTGLNSTVGTTVDGVVISPPAANPAAGSYDSSQSVSLTADGSTSIHYTTDNSTPTCVTGSVYSGAVSITSSLTLQALSCYPNNGASTVAGFAYVISPTPTPTPTQNVTQNFVSGGGGGGGGSYIASTPTPTPTPTPIPTPTGEVAGASIVNSHPDGTLVLDGSTIYLIQNNQLHGFRDPQEFASYGYKFSQTVPASAADKLLPTGEIMKAMVGTLALDTSDNRTIYMVGKNYTKRGFVSMQVFQDLGYAKSSSASGQNMRGLFKINMTDYPVGDPVASSTDTHPEGTLVKDSSGTVWWILNGQRDGFESLTVFNTYGFTFGRTVPANASDMALPVGSMVKLRDGTLVSQGGVTYIISDSQKLSFASSKSLAAWGYNPANVIVADVSGYNAGAVLP